MAVTLTVMWWATFWTVAPAITAATLLSLWLFDVSGTPTQVGATIQGLTIAPLAFTFRHRIFALVKQIARQSASNREPRARWEKLIHRRVKVIAPPEPWKGVYLAALELVGLALLLLYFVGGIVVQNVGE